MLTPLLVASLIVVPDSCALSREFTVRTPTGETIAAVLETRRATVRQPTVILISGAGAHTRDYSTASSDDTANYAYLELSRALQQAGFAVIRFDERGTGRSTGDYQRTATTASLAADVEALYLAVAKRPEVDARQIALVGHSEGGAIATLVAGQQPDIGAIVLLAAPAWAGRRIMDWQDAYSLKHGSWSASRPTEDSRRAWLTGERQRRETSEAWFSYFLDYDPLPAIRQVRVPTFVLHGQQDVQVLPEQAEELARAATEAGNRAVTLEILTGHDHALGEPAASRFPPPFSEQVSGRLVSWLTTTFGRCSGSLKCVDRSGST